MRPLTRFYEKSLLLEPRDFRARKWIDRVVAPHWRELDLRQWPWAHFSPRELASRGDGSVCAVLTAGDLLERLRRLIGKPLAITSAYRDPIHNARVGGAPLSRHKVGDAFDIRLADLNRFELADAAAEVGFTGMGKYQTFLHIDTRPGHALWYGGQRSKEQWSG